MFLLIILSPNLLLQRCQTRVVVLQLAVKSINDHSFPFYHTSLHFCIYHQLPKSNALPVTNTFNPAQMNYIVTFKFSMDHRPDQERS